MTRLNVAMRYFTSTTAIIAGATLPGEIPGVPRYLVFAARLAIFLFAHAIMSSIKTAAVLNTAQPPPSRTAGKVLRAELEETEAHAKRLRESIAKLEGELPLS